jgi:hypothetical protein
VNLRYSILFFARPFTKLPVTKLARKLRGQDRRRYTVYVQYISLCAELEEAAANVITIG